MDAREDVSEVYPGGRASSSARRIDQLAAEVAELAHELSGKTARSDFAAFDGLELGDLATQKEVREMLQTVLEKLKGLKGAE